MKNSEKYILNCLDNFKAVADAHIKSYSGLGSNAYFKVLSERRQRLLIHLNFIRNEK